MKYKVVEASGIVAIEELVTSYLKDGWKPVGGVSVHISGSRYYYTQAMIKGIDLSE